MSAILRWFHDGDIRYRAYFRASDAAPAGRELIIASSDGEATDLMYDDRNLEDFTYAELLAYARRLRARLQAAHAAPSDAAAD